MLGEKLLISLGTEFIENESKDVKNRTVRSMQYHTIETEREDLKIAGCWSHARRRFDEAVKSLPKVKRKDSRAHLALTMIQAIYREEKLLKDFPAKERRNCRQLSVRPLVEAYYG